MRHLVVVAKGQRLKQNQAGIACLFFVVVTFLHDAIKEFAAAHFLSDEIVKLLFLKDIV